MARTLFSSVAAAMSAPMKKLSAGEWLGAFGMSGATATGLDINQRTAMMSTAVMAAVSVLSEDVSKMTPEIFRRIDAGGRTEAARAIATDHFLYDLLWRPNDWQTWPEFCRMMMIGYLLRGNAYAVILRNARGVPYALVPINPDRGRLWESPDGSLFFLVNRLGLHETAVLSEYGLLIPYEDVFHLKDLVTNGLVGTSRIALAAEAIALALGQEKQYASIMGSGARPSGYLTTDTKLDPKTAERLKADWKTLQSGLGNTGGTAVLEQGLKWAPLTLTMADLEFLAARNFQVIEVCRIFRVPPHMIGDLTRGTYSNVVQGAQEYRNNTLTSHSDIWEKRFDFHFGLREKGLFVDFNEAAALKADIVSRYNVHRIAVLTGLMSQDECRIIEGLSPRGGIADELLTPSNMLIDGKLPDGVGTAGPGSDQTGVAPDGAGKPSDSVGVDNQPNTPVGVAMRPQSITPKYSEDQPRDDHGRWVDGGGGGSSGGAGSSSDGAASSAQALFVQNDTGGTADSVLAASPAGTADKIAATEKALSQSPPTNALVSAGGFQNPDGTWTAGREALHQEILGKIFSPAAVAAATPAPGQEPTVTFLGGRGGSGKTWLTGSDGPVNGANAIMLNSDHIKEALPGYAGWNAALYHEEATAILAHADKIVQGGRLNAIYDATMKTEGTTSSRVLDFKNAGYTTNGYFMHVSPEQAAIRSTARFVNGGATGRYVPINVILGSRTNERTFDNVRSSFSNWGLYNNNTPGGTPKLVAQGTNK